MSLLGLDVGTSGCKVVLFQNDGIVLASAYEEYDAESPQPGWAQLNASQVWERIKRLLKQVSSASLGDPVTALAVSSLGEAMVPVTRHREILGPSILNFDDRGREYLPELRRKMADQRLYALNGNTLGNHYSLTKLKWLSQHQPALYEAADYFLHWSGFVSFMLGAEPAVDYSLANRTLLFDLQLQDWSPELLGWAGLDPDKLPPTIASGVRIGSLSRHVADELRLPVGAAIVSGAHDQCANGVGCGILHEGQAMYGMGTFICMMPAFSQPREPLVMLQRGLNTEHHAAPGFFVSFIYNQGGSLLKWYRDAFAVREKEQAKQAGRDIYADLIAEIPEDPSRIMVLPHFTTTGPPNFISDSCGVIAGLRLETSRGEILKGILEGATYYLRQCLESLPGAGIEINELRVVGGGSKSDAWVQLSADILQRPFIRTRNPEAGSLGAAILAGTAVGEFATLADGVQAMVGLGRPFEPDASKVQAYSEKFHRYALMWPLLSDYLRSL